ncbi:hypothetical protein CN168_15540 [Sinorhizobium medicae]|nr:hypothetical protein CN168_15540 [Sinorhizobium medicae]
MPLYRARIPPVVIHGATPVVIPGLFRCRSRTPPVVILGLDPRIHTQASQRRFCSHQPRNV